MKLNSNFSNLRLAAIDLDGTLLGPDTRISEENRSAVAKLAEAGVEIVLATGRHYRSVLPYAQQLPEVKWIVTSQGAEVGTADRAQLLGQNFLSKEAVRLLVEAETDYGLTTVYYSADDVFTSSQPNRFTSEYIALSGRTPTLVNRAEALNLRMQKVIWLGEPHLIDALKTDTRIAAFGLQGVQTAATMFEFMPVETTKAQGLQLLTDHLDLLPENVVAFGDGDNDVSMFEWAGYSFAMPHGWKNALAKAKRIGPEGPPDTVLSKAVEVLLSE